MPAVSWRILSSACAAPPAAVRQSTFARGGGCPPQGLRLFRTQLATAIPSSPPRLQVVCLQGFCFWQTGCEAATLCRDKSSPVRCSSLPVFHRGTGEGHVVVPCLHASQPFRRREPKLRAGYHVSKYRSPFRKHHNK